MKQPHIIYFVADQLRYDMLGRGLTPNIDSIAREGVRFDRAYCGCPLCVPSRGVLFSGKYPNTNGCFINPWLPQDAEYGYMHRDTDNLYSLMERNGWDCLHSGKQHLYMEGGALEERPDTKTRWLTTERSYREYLKEKGVRAPGGSKFRSLVPELAQGKKTRVCSYSNPHTGCYEQGLENYFDGYFTERALAGLRERDRTKPLFLSMMFLAPHPPLDVPDPFYGSVAPQEVKLPENVGKWYSYQSPLQLYNLTGVIGTAHGMEQWRETWRVYMGLVRLLDSCVGRVLDELRSQGIYDDCLIIFTSDHGEMLGSHRLFQKMCMYEESVRTPVYLRFPKGRFGGSSYSCPVSHLDIQPTLCDYLGLEMNAPVEGRSLMPLAEHGEIPNRPVFIQFDGNGARSNFQRCVIHGRHKLIADIFKDEVYFELYDLEDDPQETRNLLFIQRELPPVAGDLLELLLAHMRDTKDPVALPQTSLSRFAKEYRDIPARGGA